MTITAQSGWREQTLTESQFVQRARDLSFVHACTLIAAVTTSLSSVTTIRLTALDAAMVFSRPALFSEVARRMFSVCQEFKVLNSIVILYLVDVMHMLIRAQESPEVLLHNQTVLKDVSRLLNIGMVRGINQKVTSLPVMTHNAALPISTSWTRLAFCETGLRTKLCSFLSRWNYAKGLATELACKIDGHRSSLLRCLAGGVPSTARPSHFPHVHHNFIILEAA